MKIYLDNCTFNRPFDDQSYIRIRIESEAKLYVQEKIKDGELELVWSYIFLVPTLLRGNAVMTLQRLVHHHRKK